MPGLTDAVFSGGLLIDGSGNDPIENATVIVRDGTIIEVGQDATVQIPDGLPVVDARGKTIMPGLIDGHVHLRSPSVGEKVANYLWQATAFIEEQTLHCAGNARIALEAGVTTVRDMAGARPEVATKHAIDDGVLSGARVIASGFVGMTAGHGDMFCPAGISERYWPPADGVDECRKLVRSYARDGLDLIELMLESGALLCPTLAITDFILNQGAAAGIPEESLEKARRLKASSLEGHRAAYEAGVPIFMGTDSSAAFRFGNHARELTLMHDQIGLMPMEAIVASTHTAAIALGIDDETGTLEAGKRADLLIVDGNPLEDLRLLEDTANILGVVQRGEIKVDRGLVMRDAVSVS